VELEVGSFVQAPPMSGNGAWIDRSGDFQKYGTHPGSYGCKSTLTSVLAV
jgi:hypothetical protein